MRRPRGTHPVYWQTLSVQPPADWKIKRIEDYAEVKKGKLPKTLYTIPTEDSIPYLLIDGLNEGEPLYTDDANLPMIDENDTVVVADGSRSGLPIRGVSGALGSTLLRFRSKEGFDPDFLYYILESLYPYTNTATIGGAVPHLDKRLLAQFELATPRQEERKKIGFVISITDELIEHTEGQLKAARRLKTGLMQQLFTKGIPGRHKRLKKTKVGLIPEDWNLGRVKELLDGIEAGSSPQCDSEPAKDGQWGILKVSAISWEEFKENENKALPPNIEPNMSARVKIGDILVSRANTTELVGAAQIVRELSSLLLLSDKTWRLLPKEGIIKEWLVHALKQPNIRHQIEARATGTSGSMKNISKRDFSKMYIGIPKKPEQQKIAEIIISAQRNIDAIDSKTKKLLKLKKSLLQNLLTGKVRVNMEASHELLRGKDG